MIVVEKVKGGVRITLGVGGASVVIVELFERFAGALR